jgi:O-antigen/teichoic acid export membrane protein
MTLAPEPADLDSGRAMPGALSGGRLQRLRALVRWNMFQPLAAVCARGFEVVAKFGFQIAVARCLSREAAGLFLLGLSITSVLQTVAMAGIGRALVLFVARANRDRSREHVFAVAAAGLGALLLFAGAIGIAMIAFAQPMATYVFHKPELTLTLRWLSLAAVCYALLTGIGGVLTALGAAIVGDFLRSSFWPALTALMLLAADHSAGSAAMLTSLSTLLGTVIAWIFMRKLAPGHWPSLREMKPPAGLIETAIPLGIVDVIGVILVSVPTLVLGSLVAAESVAVFAVANRIANVFITVVGAIGNAASPRFALLSDAGDRKPLGKVVSHMGLLSAAVCLPPALLLIAFPSEAMGLFGAGYRSSGAVLRVLILGDLVFVAFACCTELLAMAGQGKLLRRLNFVLLAACGVFSGVLIPLFGAMGAAWAMALTMSLNGLLVGFGVWRRLKLNPVPVLAGLG